MAYTKKAGSSVQVRQGNNNDLLKTFSGPKAQSKAAEYVKELHEKNHPSAANRGGSAAARFRKSR